MTSPAAVRPEDPAARVASAGGRRTRASMTPEFFTVEAAARHFAIGRTTLFDLMRTGRITRYKVGARTLVRAAEVRALIERGASVGLAVGPTRKTR